MIETSPEIGHQSAGRGPARPRVLVIGPDPSRIGGVATFVGILLTSNLQEIYELIHLDTSRGRHGEGVEGRLAPINIVYFLRQAARLLGMRLRYRPQIAHLPLNMSWAFWKEAAFVLLARLSGMKVVAHLHEGVFDEYYLRSSSFIRRMIGWVMLRADVVVALSQRWKDFLLSEVRPDLHVEVVPNTIGPMFAAAISTTGPERTGNTVLFVGGLSQKKGVIDILKAVPIVVSCCSETRFLFAGKEENRSVYEQIQRLCEEEKLNGSVDFLGVITGSEKLALFQKATIFVLPSYADNFPYVLLEALSTGLPVITTPVGAIPEIVEDGKNGFIIEPGDYKALADRIVRLLGDPALRQEMAVANTALIRDRYMPQTVGCRFDQIYGELIKARK